MLKALLGKTVVFDGKFDFGQLQRLTAMAEAQQGVIAVEIDANTNYLVLADLSAGKTIQKKAASLNARGASLQVIDADAFRELVQPTTGQVADLIRGGKENAAVLFKALGDQQVAYGAPPPPIVTFTGENFDRADLSGFAFTMVAFDHCSFAGALLSGTHFESATDCDFSRASGEAPAFERILGSRFVEAKLKGAVIHSHLENCDFTSAQMEGATFSEQFWASRGSASPALRSRVQVGEPAQITIRAGSASAPNFEGADLSESAWISCLLDSANFSSASLKSAMMIAGEARSANFDGAALNDANFAEADLTNASFVGADLENCNFRGAKLGGAAIDRARDFNRDNSRAAAAGPVLTELDTVAAQAGRIKISFRVEMGPDADGMEFGIDTTGLKYGWGVQIPQAFFGALHRRQQRSGGFADAMIRLANIVGNHKVRFGTLEVQSTKSPKTGKELRELLLNGISEAFAQPLPPAEELAAATKAYREQSREQGAADRERREAAKKLAEKQKLTAQKQIAKKIAKEVGKVTDIGSFLKALELRVDKAKIDKATKMLKAERFKLFNDVAETHLAGVVKSQTDPDLVYACRIEADGAYACCTQNLNICGGLRGSICKHLLVLIIGLVKAGELDPSIIDEWVSKSNDTKPALNKETMGEIFIRYKGAEAGEVDWRPTETVPEDYYAV